MNDTFVTEFNRYIERFKPFPWTVVRDHDNPDFIGNDTLVLAYIRFRLIMDAVKCYFKPGINVLDVGVYPGVLPKVFDEFYPGRGFFKYAGCGLGFDEQFIKAMKEIGVTLFETDLDPRLNLHRNRATNLPLPDLSVDMAFCTDVIEHFYDPNHMLRELNRVMKMGGILILTTDNVSRYGSVISLLKGKSNYPPLMESGMYFEGDWRPHFREYAKDELLKLLKYAGFEVIEHRFFACEFAEYKVMNGRLTKLKRKTSLIGKLKRLAKILLTGEWTLTLFGRVSHARDNHFIIARKTVLYEVMLAAAPKITRTIEEWVEQRKNI